MSIPTMNSDKFSDRADAESYWRIASVLRTGFFGTVLRLSGSESRGIGFGG